MTKTESLVSLRVDWDSLRKTTKATMSIQGSRPYPTRDATPKQWQASLKPISLGE